MRFFLQKDFGVNGHFEAIGLKLIFALSEIFFLTKNVLSKFEPIGLL